ncbi:1,4-dihydroxy-6-naphthoate synthase [Streptomyces eurythermus]|uniref:1,4-dihydroxy-6-naphthoate synthase n=1 Tax=Streptomyces eurythermus TaxID=42237 RepID=UPI00188D32D5|nr:1,4-dihydroxy-6-naphthoate synthase [Streptomyces eurythermus]
MDAAAAPRVVARLRDALGLEGNGRELTVGPLRVEGEPNDYATGRHAHPSDFLEWPTVLECEAHVGTPAEVVRAVTVVLEALWHGGFKAIAACDFEEELPARGGIGRYPYPVSAPDVPAVS